MALEVSDHSALVLLENHLSDKLADALSLQQRHDIDLIVQFLARVLMPFQFADAMVDGNAFAAALQAEHTAAAP